MELQQLKYSAANPTSPWTVARLATGRQSKSANSPIRKLANAYTKIVETRPSKREDPLKIALGTNQPIDTGLVQLMEQARTSVPTGFRKAWKPGDSDLQKNSAARLIWEPTVELEARKTELEELFKLAPEKRAQRIFATQIDRLIDTLTELRATLGVDGGPNR